MYARIKRWCVVAAWVLTAELVIGVGSWAWWSTHADDPLGYSNVPNSMLWKFFDQYQKEGQTINDLMDQIQKQQRQMFNMEQRQRA